MHFSTARRIVRWKIHFRQQKRQPHYLAGGRAGGPVIIIKGRENERERERSCKSWKQQQHEVEKNKTTNNNKKRRKGSKKMLETRNPPHPKGHCYPVNTTAPPNNRCQPSALGIKNNSKKRRRKRRCEAQKNRPSFLVFHRGPGQTGRCYISFSVVQLLLLFGFSWSLITMVFALMPLKGTDTKHWKQ